MFEFESKGNMKDLIQLEKDLLLYLGFDEPVELDYNDTCNYYGGVDILEDEHETKMWNEYGSVISLQKFPFRSDPFWNMKHIGNGIYNEVDVILYGQETIGAAERSCNVDEMKYLFETVTNGGYSKKLFELFGEERVRKELDDFLSLKMFPRFGGGIGLTRLARAYQMLQEEVVMV